MARNWSNSKRISHSLISRDLYEKKNRNIEKALAQLLKEYHNKPKNHIFYY